MGVGVGVCTTCVCIYMCVLECHSDVLDFLSVFREIVLVPRDHNTPRSLVKQSPFRKVNPSKQTGNIQKQGEIKRR